jgi:hypothetical protein
VLVFRDIALLQKKIIVIFQENIISRRITTNTSVNRIFYMVVERVEHYVDVCSGQLIVTCVVGKTEIPIHQESFNRCTSKWYIYSHQDTITFLYTSLMLYAWKYERVSDNGA